MKDEIQKRKLLFKQIIKCPNWHETISNVYNDNGYLYYECGICGMVVGIRRDGDLKEDVNIIGGKLYRDKVVKEVTFSGYNLSEIREIFIKRNKKSLSQQEKRK